MWCPLQRPNGIVRLLLTSRQYQRISQILCFVSCLLVAGCAGMYPGVFTPVSDDLRQKILESLRKKERSIRTLRGLFRASVSGSGIPFSQRFNGMIAYASPDTVHLRGFLKFGVPMMDFHRKGNDYRLYFPAEKELITGQVAGGSLVTQWDQTVQLSIRALDALLGKIEGLSQGEIHVFQGETHYRLDMTESHASERVTPEDYIVQTWIDAQTLEMTSIEYRRAFDEIVISVECEDYRDVKVAAHSEGGPIRLPFVVKATDHRSSGGSITLNFQEFVLNAT